MEDAAGMRLRVEGSITKEKILKIFEMMNILDNENEPETPKLDSINAKIWHIIDKYYPAGRFTSSDILEKYEDEYNEPIKLSTISTYLSRFSLRRKVQRNKMGREWSYQMLEIRHSIK